MKELDLKKRSEQLKCKIAQILNVSSDFDAIEDKKLRVVAQDLYRHCVDETTLVALDDEDVIDFATDKYGWHAFSPFINVYQGTLDSISGQMIGIPPDAYEVSVDEMQMNEILNGISSMQHNPLYRRKILNEEMLLQKKNNILFGSVLRIYFTLRQRFFAGEKPDWIWKCFFQCLWLFKKIYRKIRPWQDEEQKL